MIKIINSRLFFIQSIKTLSIIVSFLMANVLYAEEVINRTVLTVKIAVDTAVRDNPGLAEMQACYEAMAEIPSQKGTLPDPVLSFAAMNFPTETFDRDQEAMTQVQIGFSQAFPYPGKLGLREQAAEIGVLVLSFIDLEVAKRRAATSTALSVEEIKDAVLSATSKRVRPVAMTAMSTMAGLLPIILSSATGTDVTHRIAAPMLGGC